jgi:hypothetical protein
MRQLAVETAGFTSKVNNVDNNLSGVKFFGQKQATQGLPVPKSEYVPGNKYGNFYAHYNNYDLWAEDYLNILTKKSNPLGADNLTDFAMRLKANDYFQSTLPDYIKALKSWEGTFAKWLPSIVSSKGAKVSLLTIALIAIVFFTIINTK